MNDEAAVLQLDQAGFPERLERPVDVHRRQAQALTSLGHTPLVVLTARDNVDGKAGWGTAQAAMAALSPNSRHTVVDVSHVGLLTDPTGAAHTVTAIDDVVTAVRTRTPVPTAR